MTSKQTLTELFNEANRLRYEEPKYTTHDLLQMKKQIENDLEVLELFKTKRINIGVLKITEYLDTYNRIAKINGDDKLTQKEFDLLKEWLKNDK